MEVDAKMVEGVASVEGVRAASMALFRRLCRGVFRGLHIGAMRHAQVCVGAGAFENRHSL